MEATEEAGGKLHYTFWVIAGIGLAWNLIGLFAFYDAMTVTPEALATRYETDAELAFITGIPLWANVAYGVAVIGGVLGCIALLMRRRFAIYLFALSLGGVVVQNFYGFFVGDGMAVFGMGAIALPLIVVVIGVTLILYTMSASEKGWVR